MKHSVKPLVMLGILAGSSTAMTLPSLYAAPKKAVAAQVVQGTVRASTKPPRPGTVTYKDAVIALDLNVNQTVSGKPVGKEIVVFLWGMRNNAWTPAATYRPGKKVRLKLTPWEKVERKYGSYNRFELDDKRTWDLDIYWGEVTK